MAKSPRKSGSDGAPPPAATESASSYAEARRPMEAAYVARPQAATSVPATASLYMAPPQTGGAPQQLRHDGSPHAEARLNTAMRILLDPVARGLASKVYSGQARNWSR
ncbi:hypothetical protein CI1B_44920 [Bradyrhizobium ivorense]|uniref:Uncharacterized protein n=1 Tax=Bradyrhizobium ivorense TaxID=2511166 RepID=A0A508TF47_9BRAD|nr:hypothetical protein [Bradyrhizobium ivorense]VIO72844.1 hypothetical protein CI1B_44920 [Bradyrhizobium ivorense]